MVMQKPLFCIADIITAPNTDCWIALRWASAALLAFRARAHYDS